MASSATTPSARVLACRRNGAKGGRATAQRHGKDFCVRRAEAAGMTVRDRYGVDFYKYIQQFKKKKKGWPKGKPRKPQVIDLAAEVLGTA